MSFAKIKSADPNPVPEYGVSRPTTAVVGSVSGSRPGPLSTIKTRLTLLGAAVTLLVCALVCAAFYVGVSISLEREVDGFLEGEVMEFRSTLLAHTGTYAELEREIRQELGSRTRRDLRFRLLDEDGRIILASDPDDPIDDLWRPPANLAPGGPPHLLTILPPGARHSTRVCSLRTTDREGRPCIVQATYYLDRVERSLTILLRVAVSALALAVVLALLGGRIIAIRSLRPIDRMIATARQVGVRRLAERVARSGNGDEIDRLAETLNEMLDRIERQMKQIQQFTADASHEIRTPLAALRGAAEVALTRERPASDLRHVIEESIEHYDRLSRIAEDLLLLARLDAGATELHRETVSLQKAVGDIVDLYTPLASERGHELSVRNGLDLNVRADGGRLRQIVGNLIDNAIRHAGRSSRIEVTTQAAGDEAIVSVCDDGRGIAAEHLRHVFDRFYRVDPSRLRDSSAGNGLGLSICRSLAEAMDGRLEIESQVDVGTTARLVLPRAAT